MGEFVSLQVDEEGVATIRLDRPPVNALNAEVARELQEAAERAWEDPGVKAVVVWGGEKVFAAGADIKEMVEATPASVAMHVGPLVRAFEVLASLPKVVVAAINGYALGGGLELALCADFRVAAEDAQLGQPEIKLGIIPGAGGTQRLPRLVGPARAKDIIFSGRFVPAREALEIGLVDAVYPADQVYPEARKLAASYARGPLLALRAAKIAVDAALGTDLATGLALERELFQALFATEDQKEGMRSFLERGPGKAEFRGR